jgi:NTE family protein
MKTTHRNQRCNALIGEGMKRILRFCASSFFMTLLAVGCAHYPVNPSLKQVDPGSGYRGKYMGTTGNSENLLLYLTFSGGGTRAAALSYGVLEELRKTEVAIDGKKRRLLDEVDAISSVSGGSFTAGYFGLFGDRIFEDFETKFLKKNIQGALAVRTLFNPINWFRLSSSTFDEAIPRQNTMTDVFDGRTLRIAA